MIRAFLATTLALLALPAQADDTKPKGPPAGDVLAEKLALAKKDGKWLVFDVTPINPTNQNQGNS